MRLTRRLLRQIIMETTDPEFLRAIGQLQKDWEEIQSSIPTKTEKRDEFIHFYNEETEEMDQDWREVERTVQVTADEPKPSFTDENPKYYDSEHPAERRVRYGQTQKEIDLERKIMQLWQKHADIEFFKSDKITFVHDLTYRSAAKTMGTYGIATTKKSLANIVKAQEAKQKDAISVTGKYNPAGGVTIGSQSMMGNGWGFVAEGYPIFASFTDLASQTQMMASDAAKEYYKSSGLPKRTGVSRAGSVKYTDRQLRMRKRALKRRGMDDEQATEHLRIMANAVALSENDFKERGSDQLEEAIIDNWQISAWFLDSSGRGSAGVGFFRKHIAEGNITKPVHLVYSAYEGSKDHHTFYPEKEGDMDRLLEALDELEKR